MDIFLSIIFIIILIFFIIGSNWICYAFIKLAIDEAQWLLFPIILMTLITIFMDIVSIGLLIDLFI